MDSHPRHQTHLNNVSFLIIFLRDPSSSRKEISLHSFLRAREFPHCSLHFRSALGFIDWAQGFAESVWPIAFLEGCDILPLCDYKLPVAYHVAYYVLDLRISPSQILKYIRYVSDLPQVSRPLQFEHSRNCVIKPLTSDVFGILLSTSSKYLFTHLSLSRLCIPHTLLYSLHKSSLWNTALPLTVITRCRYPPEACTILAIALSNLTPHCLWPSGRI